MYIFINYRRSKSCDDEKYSHATERKSNFVGNKEGIIVNKLWLILNYHPINYV